MRTVDLAPPGSLRRAVELFRAFRVEQTDPDRFYGLLAADSARHVGLHADLEKAVVLDVGGGPGYFADAFAAQGARYLAIDADLGELTARDDPGPNTLLGSGTDLPIRSGSVDVCYSSNVLEHVERPERMAEEMVRVTRPGGIVFLSYTLWYGPWGGHETAPWHFLGGHYAARRYRRRNGKRPKNLFGESLFPITAGRMIRWAKTCADAEVVAIQPRYHPSWARFVVRIPGLRELAVWNLVLVLRRR
ncbi:MAG: Methyltransferase protein [Actinomycetia bacterium]|nr:Methyltransferase protein [Actinomycetes bacterium]